MWRWIHFYLRDLGRQSCVSNLSICGGDNCERGFGWHVDRDFPKWFWELAQACRGDFTSTAGISPKLSINDKYCTSLNSSLNNEYLSRTRAHDAHKQYRNPIERRRRRPGVSTTTLRGTLERLSWCRQSYNRESLAIRTAIDIPSRLLERHALLDLSEAINPGYFEMDYGLVDGKRLNRGIG